MVEEHALEGNMLRGIILDNKDFKFIESTLSDIDWIARVENIIPAGVDHNLVQYEDHDTNKLQEISYEPSLYNIPNINKTTTPFV